MCVFYFIFYFLFFSALDWLWMLRHERLFCQVRRHLRGGMYEVLEEQQHQLNHRQGIQEGPGLLRAPQEGHLQWHDCCGKEAWAEMRPSRSYRGKPSALARPSRCPLARPEKRKLILRVF